MNQQVSESMKKDDLKPPKIKRKRKKKSKVYFGTPVQESIIRYNALDQIEGADERNKIYRDEIHAAFMKLCENLIHTFKFYYFDVPSTEVQKEVVSFLVLNMHKYQPDKGRAFSYFSIVAKNWLILNNNNNYKRYKMTDKIGEESNVPQKEAIQARGNLTKNYYLQPHDNEDNEYNEFIKYMVLYFEKKIPGLFKKRRDIMIADSVVELFRRKDYIENFNKKALYVLVREMTGYSTQHITKVINVLKKHYRHLLNEYETNGYIDL
jgi:hypothetical protein